MLQRLDFWLAVFTLGALAWFELRLGRFVGPIVRGAAGIVGQEVQRRKSSRQLPTTVRLKPRPIRGVDGRFNGSLAAVPVGSELSSSVQQSSDASSASERVVPGGNDVPIGTIPLDEAMLIALRLGRGMSPSAVAKSLPGYSARKYQTFMEKVLRVEAELAELEPAEQAQDTA